MIRLFSPPTRDVVLRPDAVTAGSLLLHLGALVLLLVPLARVANDALFDRLVVYLVPPDPVARAEGGIGNTTYSSTPVDGGLKESAPAPAGDERRITARGTEPTLDARDLQVSHPSEGEKAYTALEVDSAIVRDPSSAAPEYPAHLLSAGVQGSVTVRFVVDSSGEVDTLSYRVLRTTHPDFAVAVRRALPFMHFTPAVWAGRRVRQIVEQPFTFKITFQDTLTRKPVAPA